MRISLYPLFSMKSAVADAPADDDPYCSKPPGPVLDVQRVPRFGGGNDGSSCRNQLCSDPRFADVTGAPRSLSIAVWNAVSVVPPSATDTPDATAAGVDDAAVLAAVVLPVSPAVEVSPVAWD